MSDSDRLYIAQRMSALLARELGEGIDSKRMVAQPLYARDVLLVCQAMRGTTLPELAQEFIDLRDGVVRPTVVAAAPADTVATATAAAKPAVATPEAATATAAASAPAPDSQSSDLPDSNPPSGWRASLWPATMRGTLFGGLDKGKKRGAAPRR